MSDKKSIYHTLSSVEMGQHKKTVQNQTYIPWGKQWGELLKHYPEATYEVHENEVGDPFTVSTMGVMVKVSVTIENITRTINYPVLDSGNKAMKIEAYSYTTKKGDKHVEACSTFNINTSIMRALTKCIALHGLSLYIYQDEIQPELETIDSKQIQTILDTIKTKNLKLSEVTKSWNLGKIGELHDVNYDKFIEWLG